MRIAPAMLAIFASLIALPFAAPPAPVNAGSRAQCTEWTSRSEPPPSIRVYRVSEGKVDTVDFKKYVMRVVSREWNVDQKQLRMAGAHAVKQYAWFHVLKWRGGTYNGRCYDVKDTTADQLYANKPLSQLPRRIKRSVNAIWSWRLLREDNKFFMTGYRRGTWAPCADDAGWRLYAKSAKQCARAGWSAERILEVYYTARLEK